MILVAVVAVGCLVARHYLRRSASGYRNPFNTTWLSASAVNRWQSDSPWVAGQPVPVTIRYNATLGTYKPAKGGKSQMLAQVWFEDQASGQYVSGHTFDVTLTTGGRETTSGSFVWDAEVPRPGRYLLRTSTHIVTPTGLRRDHGSGSSYQFDAPAPPPPEPHP